MRIFKGTPLSMQKASANAVTQGAVMKRRQHRQFSFCHLDWCYTIPLASSLNKNHDAYWEIANVKLNQWRIQRGFRGVLSNPPPPPFLNILWKWNNLLSVRPNYFIFMGYLRKNEIESEKSKPRAYEHPFQKSWIRPCKYTKSEYSLTQAISVIQVSLY